MIVRVLVLGLIAAALLGRGARGATRWYDGPWVFSPMQNCVLGTRETGSGVRLGFETDPKQAPVVGQTFYARAIFGMVSGCIDPQHATLEIVPPSGVSLAVDRAHPIRCMVSVDGGNAFTSFSPCVQAPLKGAYGLMLAPAGKPWAMPSRHIFMVEFPLRARRTMRGLAGGTCPNDVTELLALPHNDCLLAVLHVADGYRDPFLVPHQNLVVMQ